MTPAARRSPDRKHSQAASLPVARLSAWRPTSGLNDLLLVARLSSAFSARRPGQPPAHLVPYQR
jgi:hypothetical protein